MKELDYGKNYRYAHDENEAYAAGEKYFPDEMQETIYYHPVSRGLEQKIAERLQELRHKSRQARKEKKFGNNDTGKNDNQQR
jgi:putative ATPase